MIQSSFRITFAMAAPSDFIIQLLKRSNFDLLRLPELPFTTPDEREETEFAFDLTNHLKSVKIVVLDGYWFGAEYQRVLRKYPVHVVLIEDAGYGKYFADLIINQAPGLSEANYELVSDHPILALGPKYALLRPKFLHTAQSALPPKKDIQKILICFGGSDHFNYSEPVTKWFLEKTDLLVNLVLGASYSVTESMVIMQGEFADRLKVTSSLSEDEMLNLMKDADLGIVPTSGILFECIACRLPVISGVYTQNQSKLYNGFKTEGVFLDAANFSSKAIAKAYKKLNQEALTYIVEKQKKVLDGQSGSRLSQMFESLKMAPVGRLRKATAKDVELYFNWANDNSVRKNAFSQEPILLEHHQKWFNQKIKNEESHLLILEKENIPIGQIRFDKDENNEWEIDYSIDFNYRGLGYGIMLLQRGLDHLKNIETKPKVKAVVKGHNLASLKAFRNIGFQEYQSDKVHIFSYG
ncbi:MAG: hypothetical protein DHS20C18_24570 [Saprospiraceae bacterium]|nr:MAG: hypothetical protein DHS20C18_24570 [Saprospiraceae bacterium]